MRPLGASRSAGSGWLGYKLACAMEYAKTEWSASAPFGLEVAIDGSTDNVSTSRQVIERGTRQRWRWER